jgi:outer membrane biosynthesis protein TonB
MFGFALRKRGEEERKRKERRKRESEKERRKVRTEAEQKNTPKQQATEPVVVVVNRKVDIVVLFVHSYSFLLSGRIQKHLLSC